MTKHLVLSQKFSLIDQIQYTERYITKNIYFNQSQQNHNSSQNPCQSHIYIIKSIYVRFKSCQTQI